MKLQNKYIVATSIIILVGFVMLGQVGGGTQLPPPQARGGTPPPGTPINGALPIAILLALFYGVKKLLNQQK